MKRCPNCNQVFNDEYTYCLTDGATLVAEHSFEEIPTVVHNFQPTQPKRSSSKAIIYGAIAFFTLIIGATIVGLIVYSLLKSDNAQTNANISSNNQTVANTENENRDVELSSKEKDLKEREDTLKREQKRLEDEKKKIENQKNKSDSTDTQTKSSKSTATVFRPPTNVRTSPNGSIQCVIRTRRSINIFGSTGIRDNNGIWYHTDACGSNGVVHSTQIKF